MIFKNKEEFLEELSGILSVSFGSSIDYASDYEKFVALCRLISVHASEIHRMSRDVDFKEKAVYYFSMEFLIGKLLDNYLINLGVRDTVKEGLNDIGTNLDDLLELEVDPGLGNGGLGRLAACFIDSMAALGIYGTGMGLRYKFGLFKQKIVDGEQIEVADNWLEHEHPFSTQSIQDKVIVKFNGYVDRKYENNEFKYEYKGYDEVVAIPYEIPVLGFGGKICNRLRLWEAKPKEDKFDLAAFNRGEYSKAVDYSNSIEAITNVLYPDDSNAIGKKLRLMQEYLLVSAGIQNIIKRYELKYNDDYEKFPERIAIHINDTHPTMCIPELIRILIDEKGLPWDKAYDITVKTICYTNHTVLPEALEKWPIDLMKTVLPRIYMIIEEINRRYIEDFNKNNNGDQSMLANTAPLWDGMVRMANISCICSRSINGVASLHTEILKASTLKDFYNLYPEKFNNKTNGVSHRRFLIESNPYLTKLISDTIGNDWKKDLFKLEELLKYKDDNNFLDKLFETKLEAKRKLIKYIKFHNNIDLDESYIFDVQVKRMHAYKRQLLNVFRIINMYNEYKQGKRKKDQKVAFIFAGKAANSYSFAKSVIHLINVVADIVNNDKDVCDYMKVVFIENFCVSNGQVIYPACDISEQISTAGKEASGTGNMKFMMNGAVTLGTMDGANVEINHLVGNDNMMIFGLSSDEAENLRHQYYNPNEIADNDSRLKLIREQLVNGFLTNNSNKFNFYEIHDSLFKYGDEYFVIKDFDDYVKKSDELLDIYKDKYRYLRMQLVNIAKSGYFSSDRTIKEYANEIWGVKYKEN